MPDHSRRRIPADIAALVDDLLCAARVSSDPWPHLERAHLVSQPWAWTHTRVHVAMLRLAATDHDLREFLGQPSVSSSPAPALGRYPTGDTGRTTMRILQTGPVPDDIATLLEPHTPSP